MTDQTHDTTLYHDSDARPDWKWSFAFGILLILGGIVAFLNPFIASLTVEAIAAATFLMAGAMQLWMALAGKDGTSQRVAAGLLGLLLVLFALALLLNPIAGLISLTLLVGAFFLAMGVMRIWMAFRLRHREGWFWMALAGFVSVLLGVLVFAAVPAGALGILGLFLGVELVASGASACALALNMREA